MNKTALTPREKLRAAHAVLILGVHQHSVAAIMGVNGGRVAEAVKEVKQLWGIAQATNED